jgi:sugar/nucleoside kinase (ribokinase family)
MKTQVFDLVVVGHFSMDSIILPKVSKPYSVLGGAVAYVSLVARRLGATVSVISKVGSDFPKAYNKLLRREGVDLSNITAVKNELTTSFDLTYNEDFSTRTLCLRRQGSPIALADLPKSLTAKVIHIAPIAAEISFEVVEKLRQYADCLSLDPQGMTRCFDDSGKEISGAKLDKNILRLINIYKSSLEEICLLTEQPNLRKAIRALHDLGPEIVMVTMGSQGAVLSNQGIIREVRAYKSKCLVDPTGAGDVFMGGFLSEYIKGKGPFWCACVGSAAASLAVEGVGALFLWGNDEIYRRANVICENEENGSPMKSPIR